MEQPFGSMHFNSVAADLKARFGARTVKLALDAGLSCPNRDGTLAFGGCSFCAGGSGRFASPASQAQDQIALLSRKWPDARYIAYFQSYTNTYAQPERLRALWNEALAVPGTCGLAVATRPDCLGPAILDLLEEFAQKTFLWVELGLQTESEASANAFGRCFPNKVFERAMRDLSARGIRSVVHLILGLPGEDRAQMLRSAAYAASFSPYGIKLHMLYLMRGTRMGEDYLRAPWPLLTMEGYVALVCDILEALPPEITIHRLTGDAPRSDLIAPDWTRDKHAVLNAIQREFKRRGSFQGSRRSDTTETQK